MTAIASPPRVRLFGCEIDALAMSQTVDRARELAHAGGTHQHVVLNAAKVVSAERDPGLLRIIRGCSLVNADGASVVFAARVLGAPLPERVTGIDLLTELLSAAEDDGDAVYLLGATAEVVRTVVDKLASSHPRLRVAGWHDGFWQDDEDIVRTVAASGATYLFLGVPSPRKEYWLAEHLDELSVPFVMGVGGAFDVIAGVTTRAPRLFQRAGLEWLWRLAQEPRRMWRRYLVGNARFLALLAREILCRRTARPKTSAS